MITKKGSAVWTGDFKQGSGTISTETGVLDNAAYGAKSRFEGGQGTNPEELLAAAHAACFSMAFSLMLGEAGMTPSEIHTDAAVSLDKVGDGFAITSSHLTVRAKVPGADQAKFDQIAEQAKAGCPVSKLFNTEISMDATLQA